MTLAAASAGELEQISANNNNNNSKPKSSATGALRFSQLYELRIISMGIRGQGRTFTLFGSVQHIFLFFFFLSFAFVFYFNKKKNKKSFHFTLVPFFFHAGWKTWPTFVLPLCRDNKDQSVRDFFFFFDRHFFRYYMYMFL